MFITGPEVIKAVTGETVTQEELGGAVIARVEVGSCSLRCGLRRGLSRTDPLSHVVPPVEQLRIAALLPTERRPGEIVRRGSRHHPGDLEPALRHARCDQGRLRRRRVLRGAQPVGSEHPVWVHALGWTSRRHRCQSATGSRGDARYRVVDQGGALRAVLRRVQHPA